MIIGDWERILHMIGTTLRFATPIPFSGVSHKSGARILEKSVVPNIKPTTSKEPTVTAV